MLSARAALKAITNFTAIATTQENPSRVCLAAQVRQVDEATGDTAVEWRWYERNSDKPLVRHEFHFKLGYGLRNRYIMTDPGVDQPADATLLYTDYKTCVVVLFVAPLYECMMWVHESVKDAVPGHCWAAHGHFCGLQRTLLQDDEKCRKGSR
ncbi:hypothetical protein HPB50_018759 [Hyalomma asiaticum]|uniref:Uncharacterized protein n=1 Tax=Hyalomma asiaticum TaxID=266040 RepID=A0ACB7S1E3_HYAAI|nr:hypothetical protein HPB50_018759 [Hyalomma asiaticum]